MEIKSKTTEQDKIREVILQRTIDLIAMWLDGFFTIDFQQNQSLYTQMEILINSSIRSFDENKSNILLNLLHNPMIEFNFFVNNSNTKSYQKKNTKMRIRNIKRKILSNNNNQRNNLVSINKKQENLKSTLTKSKSIEYLHNEELSSTLTMTRRHNFFVFDYSIDLIASQLTLIEWDNFLDIHVCHCLNSKAQGVNSDSKQPIDPNNINFQSCLFVDNYLSKSVYKMIQFSYLLTHWVASEILISDNSKVSF